MIPPYISPSCPSPGEREIFRRLKNDPETSDWIVLHSLDIADHVRQISGEADFVIIIPAKGVLCIEVKACSSLRRENGQWFYGLDNRPDRRGPFRQASEASFSLAADSLIWDLRGLDLQLFGQMKTIVFLPTCTNMQYHLCQKQ